MALNFPTSATSGTQYTYGSKTWQWNGYAWDIVTTSSTSTVVNGCTGNLTITGTASQVSVTGSCPNIVIGLPNNVAITSSLTISGGTAWHYYNDGKNSGLDTDLVHGVSGQRFTENLQTGLLYGGVLSVNAGNTGTFDISAGSGIIVTPNATTGGPPNPTVTTVTWSGMTGVTLSGLTSQDLTFVSMNSSGSVVKGSTPFTDAQYESQIPLGALIHPTRSYISFAKTYPHVAYGQASQMDPFVRAFGPLKMSGHTISGSATTLQLNRTSGTAYAIGRNYTTDPNTPNVVTDTNATPATVLYRLYRNGSGGFTTVVNSAVDPTKYDNGTGTLATAAGGLYTIQRIFFYPTQPEVIAVYYGRATYNSIDSAKAAIPYEQFDESSDSADSAIFCAYLIVKSGASNFSNSNEYLFVQGGLFRSTSNVGGGGVAVASIDDLTDVTITSAANNDLLRYNTGTSQWVNSTISSLGIATTGSNTFTGLNTFNAGITSNNLYVTNGATFAAKSSFNAGLTASAVDTNTINVNKGSNTYATLTLLSSTGSTNYLTSSSSIEQYNSFYVRSTSSSGVGTPDIPYLKLVNGDNDFLVSATAELFASGNVYLRSNSVGVEVTGNSPHLTVNGTLTTINNATFRARGAFNGGLSAQNLTVVNGATFNSNISAPNIVNSVNGVTGAVVSIATTGANTFTGLQTMSAGMSGQVNTVSTNSASTFYPVFVSGTGLQTLNIDPTIGPLSYVPSSSTLKCSTLDLGAGALTINSTQTTSTGYYYFVASTGIYLQDPTIVQLGDVGQQAAGAKGTLLEVDPVNNRTRIYNINGSDTSLLVNGTLSAGGATFTGLVRANAGLSAANLYVSAGATFIGNISAPNIVNSFNSLTGAITLTSGSNITLTTVGNTITVASTASGGGGGATTSAANTWTALQTFSAGISASGTTAATFNGTVNFNSSTAYKPTLQYYNEPYTTPSISGSTLTLDLSLSQAFGVTMNSNINTLTISNTPSTGARAMSFTLILTADGTPRGITWGSAVKWANGTAPTITSTNTKKDVFTFMTTDAGTSWLGFVAGQNF